MQKKLKNYEVKVFLQYTGSQSKTGMVVMEVEMVSGLGLKSFQTIPSCFCCSSCELICFPNSVGFVHISFDFQCSCFHSGWEARFSEIESLVNDVNYEIQRVER